MTQISTPTMGLGTTRLGNGDRDATDYQSQQHSGLDGETSAEVPPSPLPGVKGALTHHQRSWRWYPCGHVRSPRGISPIAMGDREFGAPHSLHENTAAVCLPAAAFS